MLALHQDLIFGGYFGGQNADDAILHTYINQMKWYIIVWLRQFYHCEWVTWEAIAQYGERDLDRPREYELDLDRIGE